MSGTQTARLFRNGRSQAVRLPREFRFEGDQVRIRRTPDGVLLQPLITDVKEWFAQMDRSEDAGLSIKERNQPRAPVRKVFE